MATMLPAHADAFSSDLVLVQDSVLSGVTLQRTTAQEHHWDRWFDYCTAHHIDPYLSQYSDPVPVIQVFAQRYRDGRLAPSHRVVKSRTVEDAIRAVAQKHASMVGARDPQLNSFGKVDFHIKRQLRSYQREDSPPICVKPVPITLLLHILRRAHGPPAGDDRSTVLADVITVAFYFLLRPGEYTGTSHDDQPFQIQDVHLHLGERRLDTFAATLAELNAATSASYTLTRQKNGVGNETLSHGRANHALCCPVRATLRLLLYHRTHHTPHTQPIAAYVRLNRLVRITALEVLACLKAAATSLLHVTGIPAAEISARSLRAGGAMALLCAEVDCNVIQMLGRWHSDLMIRYLHVQAQPIVNHLSACMFNNGRYTFLPTATMPTVPD